MKTEGIKFDNEKPRWELLLPLCEFIEEVVIVLTHGSKKYQDNNWMFVFPRTRYIGASFRHLIAWCKGEKKDSETNCSHLAHLICCILFLMWADKYDKKQKENK